MVPYGLQNGVAEVERSPAEVRRRREALGDYSLQSIKLPGRWICAVVKRLAGEGVLLSTYAWGRMQGDGWERNQ